MCVTRFAECSMHFMFLLAKTLSLSISCTWRFALCDPCPNYTHTHIALLQPIPRTLTSHTHTYIHIHTVKRIYNHEVYHQRFVTSRVPFSSLLSLFGLETRTIVISGWFTLGRIFLAFMFCFVDHLIFIWSKLPIWRLLTPGVQDMNYVINVTYVRVDPSLNSTRIRFMCAEFYPVLHLSKALPKMNQHRTCNAFHFSALVREKPTANLGYRCTSNGDS